MSLGFRALSKRLRRQDAVSQRGGEEEYIGNSRLEAFCESLSWERQGPVSPAFSSFLISNLIGQGDR